MYGPSSGLLPRRFRLLDIAGVMVRLVRHPYHSVKQDQRPDESTSILLTHQSAKARGGALEAPKVRVLIIDDFEPWCRYIRSKLLEERYDVIAVASDGFEGVQKAEELQPDLILLDIALPSLNGLAAASRIRDVSPITKILFVSEYRSSDIAAEALRVGAQGYVIKSRAGIELLSAIEAVLEGGQFFSKPAS